MVVIWVDDVWVYVVFCGIWGRLIWWFVRRLGCGLFCVGVIVCVWWCSWWLILGNGLVVSLGGFCCCLSNCFSVLWLMIVYILNMWCWVFLCRWWGVCWRCVLFCFVVSFVCDFWFVVCWFVWVVVVIVVVYWYWMWWCLCWVWLLLFCWDMVVVCCCVSWFVVVCVVWCVFFILWVLWRFSVVFLWLLFWCWWVWFSVVWWLIVCCCWLWSWLYGVLSVLVGIWVCGCWVWMCVCVSDWVLGLDWVVWWVWF